MNFPWAGELHRRVGWQAALQDGPVGCTSRQAGVLHIKLGCKKGQDGGLPFSQSSACWIALLCSPPFCLESSMQPTDGSRFSFGNTTLCPAGPPISVIQC